MKKLLCTLLALTIATSAFALDLLWLMKKSDWDALNNGQKTAGLNILKACTDAPTPLGWSWQLRSIADTNEIWGCAYYAGGAWALKRKEQVTNVLLDNTKSMWAGSMWMWTDSFANSIATNGLERIPADIE